jgi:hypothetical protein
VRLDGGRDRAETAAVCARRSGGEELTVVAGEAFYEPADTPIARFDNASETEPAAFAAFYLLPEGEDRLTELIG